MKSKGIKERERCKSGEKRQMMFGGRHSIRKENIFRLWNSARKLRSFLDQEKTRSEEIVFERNFATKCFILRITVPSNSTRKSEKSIVSENRMSDDREFHYDFLFEFPLCKVAIFVVLNFPATHNPDSADSALRSPSAQPFL